MHGCGHDGHTTMLLAAARYLHETRNFDGTAYLIFQPGEEGYAGAKAMIEDGLFERFPAEQVFALHNWPGLPPGRIGITPGPAMAAADRIEITIDGSGGHGAHPHAAIDPVLVAGHIITAAQSIVSRNVSPIDTAVVSLCAMHAGNPGAMSVIPAHAKLVGTVRTFRPATQDMIERRLTELVPSIAAAFGARGDAASTSASIRRRSITTREAMFAADVAEALVGRDNVVRNLDPSMGSEDFSFMLQAKPGAFARLGQGGAEGGCFLHNSTYDFNDAVIPLGAGYLAALAETAMPLARHEPIAMTASIRRTLPATYAEARDKFLAAAQGARPRPSTRHVHPSARGAAGEDARSMDVALLGDAAAPAMLRARRRGRTASRASAAPAARSACCTTTRSSPRSRASGVRVVLRACAQSVRLLASAPDQRRQRRPQSQFPRLRDAASRQRGLRRSARVHGARHVAAVARRTKRSSARTWRAHGAKRALQAAVSGGQCEFPDGLFYGGVRASVEQRAFCARSCASTAPRAQTLGWIDFHTGLGPRGHGEKIYRGPGRSRRDLARSKRMVGRRRHVVPTTARRRRRR